MGYARFEIRQLTLDVGPRRVTALDGRGRRPTVVDVHHTLTTKVSAVVQLVWRRDFGGTGAVWRRSGVGVRVFRRFLRFRDKRAMYHWRSGRGWPRWWLAWWRDGRADEPVARESCGRDQSPTVLIFCVLLSYHVTSAQHIRYCGLRARRTNGDVYKYWKRNKKN